VIFFLFIYEGCVSLTMLSKIERKKCICVNLPIGLRGDLQTVLYLLLYFIFFLMLICLFCMLPSSGDMVFYALIFQHFGRAYVAFIISCAAQFLICLLLFARASYTHCEVIHKFFLIIPWSILLL